MVSFSVGNYIALIFSELQHIVIVSGEWALQLYGFLGLLLKYLILTGSTYLPLPRWSQQSTLQLLLMTVLFSGHVVTTKLFQTSSFKTCTGTVNFSIEEELSARKSICVRVGLTIKRTLLHQLVQHPSNVWLSPCANTAGNCLESSQWVSRCLLSVDLLSTTPETMGNYSSRDVIWRIFFSWKLRNISI